MTRQNEVPPDGIGWLPGWRQTFYSTGCRIQRRNPAQGGRASQGTSGIRTMCDRHHPGRHGRRWTAARSSDGSGGVPGVSCWCKSGRLGRHPVGQRRTGSFPNEYKPCRLNLRCQRSGPSRGHSRISKGGDPHPMRRTSEFLPGVLEENGYALTRSIKERGDNGIEKRVQSLDGFYDGFSEFGATKGAALQQAGLLHGAHPPDVIHSVIIPSSVPKFRPVWGSVIGTDAALR